MPLKMVQFDCSLFFLNAECFKSAKQFFLKDYFRTYFLKKKGCWKLLKAIYIQINVSSQRKAKSADRDRVYLSVIVEICQPRLVPKREPNLCCIEHCLFPLYSRRLNWGETGKEGIATLKLESMKEHSKATYIFLLQKLLLKCLSFVA